MRKPVVIAFTGHKGGIGKTTTCQHVAERLDESGRSTLTMTVDDQLDIAERLVGELSDVESGESWSWGNCGEVVAVPWDEMPTLDLSGVDFVLVDTPKTRHLPPIKIDAAFVLYHDYESVKNNAKVVAECERLGVPYLRVAWGDDPGLHRWAKSERIDVVPYSDWLRACAKMSQPVWDCTTEGVAAIMRSLCDGWIRFIENPGAREAQRPRSGVRRSASAKPRSSVAGSGR